ncbi:serine protease inhibitor [Arthrobacter sp. ES3-54]|nr:serine protease inhibitor [Arthrobacter sp. ES3-54]
MYFAAAWSAPFDSDNTSDLPFTKAGGEEISVPTMHKELELAYAEGVGWRAVELPYAEGFVMRLVLPGPGVGPETLSAAKLAEIAAALDTAPEVSALISLPKWDHKSSFDLRKVFESLGLAKTLVTNEDFDAIQDRLTITQAGQAANITVAEKGTVAAAVTQIDGAVTGAPPLPDETIEFDRPFLYEIVHVETGLPLFMGKVADPR